MTKSPHQQTPVAEYLTGFVILLIGILWLILEQGATEPLYFARLLPCSWGCIGLGIGLFINGWVRSCKATDPVSTATDPAPEATAPDPKAPAPDPSRPNRPLLYAFQFSVLPEAAFQNHPELIREFASEPSLLPLQHFRSKAHLFCIQAGWIDSHHRRSPEEIQREMEMWAALAWQPHKRNGYTVHVVTMPAPESPPEAYFVAIVHKDDESKEHRGESPSTRYFTLEKGHAPLPFLCECQRDGSRRNYGEGPAPDMSAFVETVFERIKALEPGSNRVLLDKHCAQFLAIMPGSPTDYHLVSVEFEDGSRVDNAKVYRFNELELPPEFLAKKIKTMSIPRRQP